MTLLAQNEVVCTFRSFLADYTNDNTVISHNTPGSLARNFDGRPHVVRDRTRYYRKRCESETRYCTQLGKRHLREWTAAACSSEKQGEQTEANTARAFACYWQGLVISCLGARRVVRRCVTRGKRTPANE